MHLMGRQPVQTGPHPLGGARVGRSIPSLEEGRAARLALQPKCRDSGPRNADSGGVKEALNGSEYEGRGKMSPPRYRSKSKLRVRNAGCGFHGLTTHHLVAGTDESPRKRWFDAIAQELVADAGQVTTSVTGSGWNST